MFCNYIKLAKIVNTHFIGKDNYLYEMCYVLSKQKNSFLTLIEHPQQGDA